jgi:DNA polymerase III subunit epsilon
LLDAELLADIYICLTRGQNALMIDASESLDASGNVVKVDFSNFIVPIVMPNERRNFGA